MERRRAPACAKENFEVAMNLLNMVVIDDGEVVRSHRRRFVDLSNYSRSGCIYLGAAERWSMG
jgi:hypothetical protein